MVRRQLMIFMKKYLFFILILLGQSCLAMNTAFNRLWIFNEGTTLTLKKKDALIKQLTSVLKSESCIVLSSNNVFMYLDEQEAFDEKFHVYDHSNQYTLMIPKIDAAEPLLDMVEDSGEFAGTNIREQRENCDKITSEAMLNAIGDTLKTCTMLKYFFISGHGNKLKRDECSSLQCFLEKRKACGVYLADLLDIYKTIHNQGHIIFQQTCFGTDKDIENVISQCDIKIPLVSMCFDRSPAAVDITTSTPSNYKKLLAATSGIGLLTGNNEPDLFKALDIILACEKNACNIPYIMWPHDKKFRPIRQNLVMPEQAGYIKIHDSCILTEEHVPSLEIRSPTREKILGGSLGICEYTIDKLNMPKVSDIGGLLRIFHNKDGIEKKNYSIKSLKAGTIMFKNVAIACAQHAFRLELENSSGNKIIVMRRAKKLSSNISLAMPQ